MSNDLIFALLWDQTVNSQNSGGDNKTISNRYFKGFKYSFFKNIYNDKFYLIN